MAEVRVLLTLHNEGSGEAKHWKVAVTTVAGHAFHLHRESRGAATDHLIEDVYRVLWQSSPGLELGPDAERELELVTDYFPMSEKVSARVRITT